MWPVAMGGKGLPPRVEDTYGSKGAGAGNEKHTVGTGPGVLSVRLKAGRDAI